MKIVLTMNQAKALGYPWDSRTKGIVRACFFLGYSLIFIGELLRNPRRQREAADIVDIALSLGMTDEDDVHVEQRDNAQG